MSDLKEKQDYLYRQIIQKNYDPEEFQEVMEQHKGLDLQNYTLEELANLVTAFKQGDNSIITESSYLPSAEQKKEVEPEKVYEGQGKSLKEQQTEQKHAEQVAREQMIEHTFNSSNKVFHQFVKKQEVSDLYTRIYNQKQPISITINSFSKKEQEGFFGATYIAYIVECPHLQWKVYRRYKDFEWLQSKLSQLLPGYPIPPIPRKTKIRSFSQEHLEQRMNIFEQYLNKLLQIPQICSEPIIEQFLKSQNAIEFQAAKHSFQNHLQNRGKKISTLKGEDIINKQHFKICTDQFQFFKTLRVILHSLNTANSNFIKSITEASKNALQVSAYFNDLHKHLKSRQGIKGVETADLLSQFICDLGYKLEREGSFVRTEIDNHWTYEEKHVDNIVGMMNRLNKQQSDSLKKFKNISELPIDSQNHIDNNESRPFMEYLQTRELFRLKLSFLQYEVERYCKENLSNYVTEWTTGLSQYMNNVKQQMLIGVDQLTKAICLNEGKQLREVEYISRRPSRGQKQQIEQMKKETIQQKQKE